MHFCIKLFLIAAAAVQAANPKLRYFSVWDLETGLPALFLPHGDSQTGPVSEAKGWNNFIFTSSDPSVVSTYHQGGVGPNLLHVRDTFFTGSTLRSDYKERWSSLLKGNLTKLISDGAAMGVFLGDELCWSCITYGDLTTVVNLARSSPSLSSHLLNDLAGTLPSDAIVYYNEAYPVFTDDVCSKGTKSWLSIDYYPDEGTVDGTRKIFDQLIYPKMSPHQGALFVPPAYGAGNDQLREQLCCNQKTRDGANPECHSNCTEAMIYWAQSILKWAEEDSHLIGLNPWHYNGEPKQDAEFEPGMRYMPGVLAEYKNIGHQIISQR